ncbi:hypothetical protein Tco_0743521 [Tanacetum coccineum]
MSSVLGSSVSFVTSLSFSTTGGGFGGPSYETPLRVVIALASFLGFGMVLLGKEFELEVILSSREAAICCISKELLEGEELERGASVLTLESLARLLE